MLPDGSPFASQFDGAPEIFQDVRRQALQQAEESAEKACLVWADEKSLLRLGFARMLAAEEAARGPAAGDAWRSELLWEADDVSPLRRDPIETMKCAGRCFLKSIQAHKTEAAERHLAQVRAWLADRKVQNLFPDYV